MVGTFLLKVFLLLLICAIEKKKKTPSFFVDANHLDESDDGTGVGQNNVWLNYVLNYDFGDENSS